jgi:hypothetical protein
MTKAKPTAKPKPKETAKPGIAAKALTTAKVKAAATAKSKVAARPVAVASRRARLPRAVAAFDEEVVVDVAPDQPFEEGAHDVLGPDLRHRMISEAAYYRYAQRGYADGYDIDDWVAAEEEVDHLLLNPPSEAESSAAQ